MRRALAATRRYQCWLNRFYRSRARALQVLPIISRWTGFSFTNSNPYRWSEQLRTTASTLRGLLTTGTKNLRFTAAPASHPVTNKPATPASLILSARPRITSCFSLPNVATWISLSISYRGNRRASIELSYSSGEFIVSYHFLNPARLARLSPRRYKSRKNDP